MVFKFIFVVSLFSYAEFNDSILSLQGRQDNSSAKIENKYKTKTVTMYANKEAYRHFVEMAQAAKKYTIKHGKYAGQKLPSLKVISAKRPFNHQRSIWNHKWTSGPCSLEEEGLKRAKCILEFSSMPGTSRHHWGTDMDFNSLKNSYFESGKGKKLYEWLELNACKYGFFQPYDDDRNRDGYNEEKWHWSYKPIADRYLSKVLREIVHFKPSGFLGSERLSLGLASEYIFGITERYSGSCSK